MGSDQMLIFESDRLDEDARAITSTNPIARFQDYEIDKLFGGIQNRLYILGAQPGAGKSTLLLQWADEFASKGHPVLFVNLEMPRTELLKKSLSRLSLGKVPLDSFGGSKDPDLSDALKRYREIIASNIIFVDRPISLVDLSICAGNIKIEREVPPIIFVDYIQIVPAASAPKRSFVEERVLIKDTVAGLRDIANGHGCPVFAISSIRRTDYLKASAGLDALAEAQALEYGADVVAFLTTSKDAEQSTASRNRQRPTTLTIAKNRYGETGSIRLMFNSRFAEFEVD